MTFRESPFMFIAVYGYCFVIMGSFYINYKMSFFGLKTCMGAWQNFRSYKTESAFLASCECFGAIAVSIALMFINTSVFLSAIPTWFYGTYSGQQFLEEVHNSWYLRNTIYWGVTYLMIGVCFIYAVKDWRNIYSAYSKEYKKLKTSEINAEYLRCLMVAKKGMNWCMVITYGAMVWLSLHGLNMITTPLGV